jgi:hypothetical protein
VDAFDRLTTMLRAGEIQAGDAIRRLDALAEAGELPADRSDLYDRIDRARQEGLAADDARSLRAALDRLSQGQAPEPTAPPHPEDLESDLETVDLPPADDGPETGFGPDDGADQGWPPLGMGQAGPGPTQEPEDTPKAGEETGEEAGEEAGDHDWLPGNRGGHSVTIETRADLPVAKVRPVQEFAAATMSEAAGWWAEHPELGAHDLAGGQGRPPRSQIDGGRSATG